MFSKVSSQTSWAAKLCALILLCCLSGGALAGTVSYVYDTLGRLAKATYSNGLVITYAYDAAGNRSQTVVTGAP